MNEFLKKYAAWVGAGAALLFALGFGAARYTMPVKVVEKEKIVEKVVTDTTQKTVVQTNEKKDEQKQVVKRERRHVQKTEHVVVRPDGSKDITRVTTVDTGNSDVEKTDAHQDKQTTVQQDTKQHQDLNLTLEKSKETTYARSNFRVSVLGGLDLGSLKFNGLTPSLSAPGLVYGAEFERRVFWNVWAGAWATKLPGTVAGGVKLSLEF